MEAGEIAEDIQTIIIALLQGKKTLALALLRALLRDDEYRIAKRYTKAIARVKCEFERLNECTAYPLDFSSQDRLYWDGMIGYCIEAVGVGPLIDDLRAAAGGKWNILYFLMAEKGKRTSRWDGLIIRKEEEKREREKAEYAAGGEAMMKQLGEILGGKAMKRVDPDWVRRLELEQEEIIDGFSRREIRMTNEIQTRLQTIQIQLGKYARGEL